MCPHPHPCACQTLFCLSTLFTKIISVLQHALLLYRKGSEIESPTCLTLCAYCSDSVLDCLPLRNLPLHCSVYMCILILALVKLFSASLFTKNHVSPSHPCACQTLFCLSTHFTKNHISHCKTSLLKPKPIEFESNPCFPHRILQ